MLDARWGLQHGRSVIPKSTKPSRIKENITVFDSELSTEEMTAIDALDTGRREDQVVAAARSPLRSPLRGLGATIGETRQRGAVSDA